MLFPALDRGLITLGGLLDGFLLTLLETAKETTAMGPMIADPKLSLDHLSHPRGGPDLSTEAEGLRSFAQQAGQLRSLLRRQFRRGTGCWLMTQSLRSLHSGILSPLAHRTLADSQCASDVFLFPSVFMQFPSAHPSSFAPIFGKYRFLAHTSLYRRFAFFLYVSLLTSIISMGVGCVLIVEVLYQAVSILQSGFLQPVHIILFSPLFNLLYQLPPRFFFLLDLVMR